MEFTVHGRCVMSYKSKGINSIIFALTTLFNSMLKEWFKSQFERFLSLTFSERILSFFLLRIFYFLWILLCFVPMLRTNIMTLLPWRSRRTGPDLYYIYCYCESLYQYRAIGWEPQCCYSTTMYGRHCLRRQHLYKRCEIWDRILRSLLIILLSLLHRCNFLEWQGVELVGGD